MGVSTVDDWVQKITGAEDSGMLREYQREKFREAVRYAKEKSAFYRTRLPNAAIPFTYPEDIEKYSQDMLCIPQSKVNRVVTHTT